MTLYQLDKLEHRYDGQPVLTIDRWQVMPHTIVGLVGPNGSGKSTLLRLLGFVEQPSQGTIHYDGRKVEGYTRDLRTHVTLLPQQSYLLKRSVYQNIAYGLHLRNHHGDVRSKVNEALEWVGLAPERFAQRPWFALSGGEARRVALAARLVLRPRVFLLDEPTTSVDATSAHMMKESVMRARREWNTTLIISSHDTEWLNDISDQTLFLFRGHVLEGGQPTIIFGPWDADGGGMVYKATGPDERLVAPAPPQDAGDAVAVIDGEHMTLHSNGNEIPASLYHLKGHLVRLSLEKSHRRIGATVSVGSLTLQISLEPDIPKALSLTPGQTVWIGYDPNHIRWMT